MNIVLRPAVLVVGLTALPFAIFAHFKLLEPAEWVKTSDLGDPRKPVRAACKTPVEITRSC